jgi:HEAT repeat protein
MVTLRRLFIFTMAALIAAAAGAQSRPGMSVEQSYLQETVQIMIINQTARSPSREQKLLSLALIEDMITGGSKNDEIRQTLDFLVREGRASIATENGRVVNNFPDIRWQAAKYLGQFGTEEARRTLLDICQFENEPTVLYETIKSLGDIGIDNNNDAVVTISQAFSRFDRLNPNDSMAYAVIYAFENIARKNGGVYSREAVETLLRISDGNYITPVRDWARDLITGQRRTN